MNSQLLRIIIAGALSVISLGGVILLAMTGHAIPQLLELVSSGALFYLFGVTTNGAGLGIPPRAEGPPK